MSRIAGYQAFCWLALAFVTLGGTSSLAAMAVLGLGLTLTGVAAWLRRAAARRATDPASRP